MWWVVVTFVGNGYSSHLALLSCWRSPSGVMSTDVGGWWGAFSWYRVSGNGFDGIVVHLKGCVFVVDVGGVGSISGGCF